AAFVAEDRRIGRVEAVQELAHRGQRLGVHAGGLGVADPQPDQQPAGELAHELRVFGGELRRLVLPDVDDARGDGQTLGRLEQRAHRGEAGGAAEPEDRVAELLDEGRRLTALLALLAQRARRGPHSDAAYAHDGRDRHPSMVVGRMICPGKAEELPDPSARGRGAPVARWLSRRLLFYFAGVALVR